MNPMDNLSKSLLEAISDIMKSVVSVQIEKDVFTEIGCYFYRASVIIMELKINWSTPTNTVEILQSLCKRVESAKGFAKKLEKNVQMAHSSELRSIVDQLQSVLKNIGENLALIPLSTFGNQQYAEAAAKGLSKDMRDISFALSPAKEQFDRLSLRDGRRQVETDLYSVDVDFSAVKEELSDISAAYSTDDQERSRILERLDSKRSGGGSSLMAMPQLAQYMEPLYETFFCPLTKRVMEDPVTIESGVTYERTAITEWLDRVDSEELVCPKSGQKLRSRVLSPNVALKATVNEWKERNEAARIKVARAALSLASSDNMVLEAINDLKSVCKSRPYNKVHVRGIGMVPLLAKFLEYRSRSIRHATLELLRQLAEDDEEGKVIPLNSKHFLYH